MRIEAINITAVECLTWKLFFDSKDMQNFEANLLNYNLWGLISSEGDFENLSERSHEGWFEKCTSCKSTPKILSHFLFRVGYLQSGKQLWN